MGRINIPRKGYILAVLLGALGGGIFILLITRAIPKMMSRIMSGMMQNMMAQMKKDGSDPAEMCKQMMAKFGKEQQENVQREG